MYVLGLNKSNAESYGTSFLGGSNLTHQGMLCYFTGPVPASIEDIPFDTHNALDIFENMEGCLRFDASLSEEDSAQGKIKFVAQQSRTFTSTKQPYFDVVLDKWSYTPSQILIQQVWTDRKNGNFNTLVDSPSISGLGSMYSSSLVDGQLRCMQQQLNLNFANQGQNFAWNKFRQRDTGRYRSLTSNDYDYYSYWGISSSRNAGNLYPLVLEYAEPISVDSFEYYRGWFGGNANSPTSVVISYWDEALNEGQGDWVEAETVALVESGTETPVQVTELLTPLTSTAFKLSFGDTVSSTFYMSWFRFLSNTSPITPRESIDITWGLVIPHLSDFGSFGSYYNQSNVRHLGTFEMMEDGFPTYRSQNWCPSLLVDIGDAHNQDTTVNLTKATDVKPGDVPELLNYIIEFIN